MKSGVYETVRNSSKIVVGVILNCLVSGCALETKQDREFVKPREGTQTEASGSRPSEQVQPLQQTSQSPEPNQAAVLPAKSSSDAIVPTSQANTTNQMTGTSQNTGAQSSGAEKTGAKGTCAEGKVLGSSFIVNTESGVNLRRDANATSERIGGFANGAQLQSWKAKDTVQAALPNWQCVTGKDIDGKELTGWVSGTHLKQ